LSIVTTQEEALMRRTLGVVAIASLLLVGLVAAGSRAQPACAVPTNDNNVGFSTFNRSHFGQQQLGLVVLKDG
jgi:hypothetical protein